jgi:hypothetical protein
MSPRSWFALALLAPVLLLSAACGGDEGPANGGEPPATGDAPSSGAPSSGAPAEAAFAPAAALQRMGEVTSYRFAMTTTLEDLPGAPGSVSFAVEGALDVTNDAFQMVMDFGEFMGAMAAQSGASSAELAQMQALFGDGKMEMLQVGEVLYLRWPLINTLFGVQTPWTSVPSEGAGADFAGAFGADQPLHAEQFLGFIQEAGGFELAGTERVRGVETARYRGHVDMEAASAALGGAAPLPADAGAALDALGHVPFEVWVDGDGYIRRLSFAFDLGAALSAAQAGDAPQRMAFTVEYFDIGAAIDLRAPDASQVTELDAASLGLLGGMGMPAR